jgi:hypothetical protein
MEKKSWYIFIAALVILIALSMIDRYFGYFVYPGGYQSFGQGFYSVLDLYYQYPSWFDFAIFLAIFIGLGKTVLGEKLEGVGGKAVYIALGVFLALALLIWEERSGFYLLEVFGPYIFIGLILILAFYLFKWIKGSGVTAMVAIPIAYIFFYLFFNGMMGCYGGYGFSGYYLTSLIYYLPVDICWWMNAIFVIMCIIFFIALIKLVFGRGGD